MRDSLFTLAGACLSFFLLVSLMTPQSQQRQVSRPTTEDAGKHGHKALQRWLAENSVNTLSLRKPFSRIDEAGLPASGNLMILSLPLEREALDSEWAALNRWIANGNTVLVLAGMYHNPQWREYYEWTRETELIEAIESLTAGEFTLQRDDVNASDTEVALSDIQSSILAFKPASYRLYPATEHAMFDQVHTLASWHTPGMYQFGEENDASKSAYWSIDSASSRLALRLLYGESLQQSAMWLLPLGKGWVYWGAFTDMLSNSVLKHDDNARWFGNLLSHTLADNGYVVFDDFHFGLSDLYDPDAFFADKRLHNTLLFIGAFWLIYALGRSPRLAPVKKLRTKPASTDFIEATAGFFCRRIKTGALSAELAERLLEDIRQRTQLEGESMWRWLHDHPDVSVRDLQRLQRASDRAPGRTKLIALSRSIHRIHKILT